MGCSGKSHRDVKGHLGWGCTRLHSEVYVGHKGPIGIWDGSQIRCLGLVVGGSRLRASASGFAAHGSGLSI